MHNSYTRICTLLSPFLKVQKVEDSKFESDIKPNEPRLTDEMINISDQLASCDDSEMRHDLECKLRNLCLRDSHFDVVVCGLKWSKVFCVWKYPEIRNSVKNNRALNDSADSMNFTLDSVMGGDDESEDLPVEVIPSLVYKLILSTVTLNSNNHNKSTNS